MEELEKYIVQTGNGGVKYEIPAGELGNNTGSSVSFVLPEGCNSQTNIAGYIQGEISSEDSVSNEASWRNVSTDILNDGANSSIVVELENGDFGYAEQQANAQVNLEKLDYVYNLVGGNKDDVTLYGASNGSVFAVSTAAESVRGNSDISIGDVVVVDYYDSHNRSKIFEDDLKLLAGADVSITGITDSENSNNTTTGTRKLLIDYSELGGEAILGEFEGTEYSHETKCAEPIRRGFLDFISGNGELQDGKKQLIFTEYLNGKKADTSLSYDEVKAFFGNSSTGSESIISLEYQFINLYMDKLKGAIKDTNILSVGNITSLTNGSATLLSAVNAFNNYSSNSTQFLSSLSIMQNNILVIAQSYANLDSELAGTIDSNIVNNINSIDLSGVNKFFDTPLAIDISDNNGNILINRETLSNFTSDSNLLISTLLTDISDTKEIESIIDSFSSESTTKLQGEEWDIIRNKCNEFSELCDKKIKYAQSLINGITDACKKLLDYLEDYDELDTSKISDFEVELVNTIESIKILNERIASLKAEEGTFFIKDAYGNTIGSYTIDNSGLIAACEEQIKICDQIKKELERVLDKLYGLAGIDASTSDIITNAESENKTENISQNILSGPSGGASGLTPGYETDVGNTGIIEDTQNNNQEDNQDKNESTINNSASSSNNTLSSSNNISSSNNASSSNSNNNTSSNSNISSSSDKEDSTLSGENDIVSGTDTGENNSPENVITPNQDEEKTEINTSQSTTVTPSTPNKKSNGVKSTILKVVGGIGVAAGAVGGAIGIKKKMDKNNQIDEEENKNDSEEE